MHRPESKSSRDAPARLGVFSLLPSRVSSSPHYDFAPDTGFRGASRHAREAWDDRYEYEGPLSRRRRRRIDRLADDEFVPFTGRDSSPPWWSDTATNTRFGVSHPESSWYPQPLSSQTPPPALGTSSSRPADFRAARRRNWLAGRDDERSASLLYSDDMPPPSTSWPPSSFGLNTLNPPPPLPPLSSTSASALDNLADAAADEGRSSDTLDPLQNALTQSRRLSSRGALRTGSTSRSRHSEVGRTAGGDNQDRLHVETAFEMGFGIVEVNPYVLPHSNTSTSLPSPPHARDRTFLPPYTSRRLDGRGPTDQDRNPISAGTLSASPTSARTPYSTEGARFGYLPSSPPLPTTQLREPTFRFGARPETTGISGTTSSDWGWTLVPPWGESSGSTVLQSGSNPERSSQRDDNPGEER